jgi:mercuric ion transport protein
MRPGGMAMFTPRGRFLAAAIGTAAVAVCCFTPVLLIVLVAIGLSALTPYLDYVLIPALVVMVYVTWRAYREYASSRRAGGIRS